MRRSIPRAVVALLAGLALALSPVVAHATPEAARDSVLSPVGDQAISDLRECLASTPKLDVFYLVDASGSLFAKPGQVGSDPEFVRADLIAASLEQFGRLDEGLTLSYGLGFFGTTYRGAIPWTTVDRSSLAAEADRVRSTIRDQGAIGWTDWEEAVGAAQLQLSEQRATSGGCQTLVWLTDGGINLDGNNGALDDQALNSLCGASLRPGYAPAAGYGAFNELRQSGVVVFGVLLRAPGGSGEARDDLYAPYMKPLVEGVADVSGKTVTCGQQPQPEGHVSGAFVQASSAADLSRVLANLGAAVEGGYANPFEPDGAFSVDRGVSRFVVLTASSDWSLTSPTGQVADAAQPGPRMTVSTVSGVSRIEVSVGDEGDIGRWGWRSDAGASDDLYYYSGLSVVIDPPATFLAGADNVLSGRIGRTDGRDVGLDAYEYDLDLSLVTAEGHAPISRGSLDVDEATGEFVFHLAAEEASGVLTLRAAVENLSTVPSSTPLAPTSATRAVTVTLPDQYPTVSPAVLSLSDLVGAGGRATGEWTISPPADGTSGAVCFPAGMAPEILTDGADRADRWRWSTDLSEDCIRVDGDPVRVTVSAENPVAANSLVEARVPVAFVSAGEEEIAGSLPLEFETLRPVNAVAFGITSLLLLIGGILLPLAALVVVNWWSHRISRGPQIQRAQFAVDVLPSGELRRSGDGAALRSLELGLDDFPFFGNLPDERSMTDPGLGTLAARVPWNPFGSTWFEIVPPAGRLVVGPAAFLPHRRAVLAERGRLAGFEGDLGRVWGLVVAESDVVARSATEPMRGVLVVYVRNTASDRSTLTRRMAEVLNEPALKRRLDRAASLASQDARPSTLAAPTGTASGATPPASAPPGRNGSEPPPPSRRGSSEPPRPGGRAAPAAPPPGGERSAHARRDASPDVPPPGRSSIDPPPPTRR